MTHPETVPLSGYVTSTTVRPLADRVLVRPEHEPGVTEGGIHIPQSAKQKPVRGTIIAVGEGRTENGQLIAPKLRLGDVVIYGKYSGTEIDVDGEPLMLLRESDIVATVEELG